MKIISDIGIQIPQVYLPRAGTDLQKWAVIACDQFTSEPEYWHTVENIVGDAPSTLNLTFPEVYLEQSNPEKRIQTIQSTMRTYLDEGVLLSHEGLIYVERTAMGRTRNGVMVCLDLERYDFNRGSINLIRATEGTIVDRLPPRIKIRSGAVMELPHILVLIDDPDHTVIEPLSTDKTDFEKLYDFDLMLESGHLTGYAVNEAASNRIVAALRHLAKPEVFAAKYGTAPNLPVLLFAMGDGNHSLATAKAIWEQIKSTVGMDHPARYALVEIENVHDTGLTFEPIHRVLFNLNKNLFDELTKEFGAHFYYTELDNMQEMVSRVDGAGGHVQTIGLVGAGKAFGVIEILRPSTNLAVGTIQKFLDRFLAEGGAEKIDYVHGREVVERLGLLPGNAGFYLAGMRKDELFKTVIMDGALPRKTFSMGEAREKRFYMEARRIS